MIILIIAISAYYIAINAYGAMLLVMQKQEREKDLIKENEQNAFSHEEKENLLSKNDPSIIYLEGKCERSPIKNSNSENESKTEKPKKDKSAIFSSSKKVSDMQLIITSILGGSLGIFIALIVLRYRLKNMLFMVILPVISAIYISLLVIFIVNVGSGAFLI